MRVRVSRLSALVCLAALVLTAMPAAAAPTASSAAGPGRVELAPLPADALGAAVVDGELVRAPRSGQEALLSVRDHRDVRAWLGSIALAVRDAAGLQAAGAAGPGLLPDGDEDETGEEWEPWTGSFADALPAGDLDGDGGEDVLVADYDLEHGTVQLRALRGSDGTLLWRQPFAADGALAFPVGRDLDGDGVDDLLRLSLQIDHTSYESSSDSQLLSGGYEARYTAAYRWSVAVVSGADGSTRWTRTARGALDERYHWRGDDLGEEERYELESTNLGFFPLLLDGGEVALEGIDLDIADRYGRDGTFLAGADELELTLRSATRLDVRAGGTGAHLRGLTLGPAPAIAFLTALPERAGALLLERSLIGDEHHACTYVLVVEDCTAEVGELGTEIALLDAVSFAPRWTRTSDAFWGFVVPLTADLSGSGVDDLALLEISDEGYGTTLLDGADGTTAWSLVDEVDWRFPLATGALGGAAGPDLLTAAVEWEDDLVLRLDRLEGASGEVLASSRYVVELPEQEWEPEPTGMVEDVLAWLSGEGGQGSWTITFISLYAYGLPDIDGDGFIDVGMGSSTSTWSYPSSEEDEDTWDVRVESGATTDVLHTDGGDGYGFLYPLADVTGDGVPEARRVVYPSGWWDAEDAEPSPQQITSLQTFTALWEASAWAWLLDAGDQDGLPGSEVLQLDDEWDEDEVSTTITSRTGATGAVRWTVGSERQP